MKELDFLPRSYLAALEKSQQNRRNVLMTIGLVLALASLHILNVTRIRSAQAALASLQNGSGGWQSARTQLAALEARRALYRRQASLISKLDDPAPLDAAIGEITRLMDESMAFKALTVTTQAPPAPAAAPAATLTPSAAPGAAPPAPETQATIEGFAVKDLDVGVFVGKLGSSPLFADVTPSTHAAAAAGRLMTEFQVRLVVRPVEAAP